MKYLIILSLLVSCGSGRRKYPWKPRKGQSFIGHKGNGIGILKDQDTLFLGRFKQGYKEGVFKIIYPNGDVSYQFYKRNRTHYRDVLTGGFVIQNGKAYKTYPEGDHNSRSYEIGDKGKNIKRWVFPKKKSDKFSESTLEIVENELNHYRSGNSLIYYTNVGHSFSSYKQDKDIIYATYKDKFGTELYHKFTEEKLENRHTIFNKKLAIEISKVKLADGVYQGETKNGIPHGFGSLTNGREKIIGYFENGKANGTARYFTPNGVVHFGNFKHGKKHGAFLEMYTTYQAKKTTVIDLDYMKSLEDSFAPLEKWYKEKWLMGDQKAQIPAISLPNITEFKEKRGEIGKGFNKKKRYYTTKNSLQNFSITNIIRHFHNVNYQMDATFDYYYEDLTKTDYRKGYKYRVYENDKFVKNGIYRRDITKGCPKKTMIGNETYYPNSCEDPRFYVSNIYSIIHNPVIEDENIISGYRALYRFGSDYGYNGEYIDGKREGYGLEHGQKVRGYFKNNKLEGLAKKYDKKYYAVGKFEKGLREGEFIKKGDYNDEYQIGEYKKGKAQGTFDLIFVGDNLTGSAQYKDGVLDGETVRRYTKDNTIYNQFTFVDGKKEGKGICRINSKSEPCEFKNGKRVDFTFKDREAKKKARIAAKKKEEERRREKERRRKRRLERERKETARKDQLRRKRNTQMMLQNFQNQINSIKNTATQNNFNPNKYLKKKKSYNTYKDYSKPQTKKSYSNNKSKPKTNTTSSSRGSPLTLTRGPKPYKQCILEENYNGNIIKASYNCNDKEGTIGKARESIAESKAWYQKEEAKRAEAKRLQEERLRIRKEKGIKACNEFFSKAGHRCSIACDPKIFDKSGCKVNSI